jgi:L-ascorbate metabolism protein UlaG (beta-lactamase superfamily)
MRRLIVMIAAFVALAACKGASTASGAGAGAGSSTGSSSASLPYAQTDVIPTSAGPLGITPIHHATLLFDFGGKRIYLDPFSEAANLEAMPKADFVFITDIHPDHLDKAALDKVRGPATKLVGPPAVDAQQKMDVVLANGDKHDFDGFSVEGVPMYNLSRGPSPGKLFHDKGRGDGFVFTFGDQRVYVSGDTECTPEMKSLANVSVAFVCMNLPYTMPPKEAAECVNAFHPKVVFPYHFRGSSTDDFKAALDPAEKIDVRVRTWY